MHDNLCTFPTFTERRMENYFCLPRLTIIESIWLKELTLLEEIIKPIQSFIIHMYKAP